MGVAAIMTRRVVTVKMDDTLGALRERFDTTGFHHLLVVENEKLVGVISDRDLLKALSPFIDTLTERARDRATLKLRAEHIMTQDIISISEQATITRAIILFNRHPISCLPVVDKYKRPVGILSWRDIMHYMEDSVLRRQDG